MSLVVWAKEIGRIAAYWRKVGAAQRDDDGTISFTLNAQPLLEFEIVEAQQKEIVHGERKKT